jgi:hypothetical protein
LKLEAAIMAARPLQEIRATALRATWLPAMKNCRARKKNAGSVGTLVVSEETVNRYMTRKLTRTQETRRPPASSPSLLHIILNSQEG